MVATPPRVASRSARTPADRAGHDHRVAGLGVRHAQGHVVLDHAHAGGVDVAPVGLAPLHHLGVPGDHLHPRDLGRGLHRGHDLDQVGDREALLQDEPGGQVERGRAGHRQVVDGPVDREVADVAAGKDQRRHHVGVGGQSDPAAVHVELGGVFQGLEQRVAERVQEDRLDQGPGGLAAGPVGHGDPLLADLRPAAPGLVDAVEDLLLAVGGRGRLRAGMLRRGVLLVLAQGLVDPGAPAGAGACARARARAGHEMLTSTTRRRFIRPKL
jgi:hypothetical protein